MQKKKLFKLLISSSLAFALAGCFLILSNSKTYQTLELKAFDLRFILRGNKEPKAAVLHIDIDDASLDKLGRWPWPRSYHAKLIDTLFECGAKQVAMDILFTEKLKDKPEDDSLFAESMLQAKIAYLPFYFTEDKTPPSAELRDLLHKDISITIEDAARSLSISQEALKDKLPQAKRYVMDEVVKEIIRKTPDISIEDLLKTVEDTKGWFLFSDEENYIRENFTNQKAMRFFVNKFGRDYPKAEELKIKEYKNFSPPINEYCQGIRGTGFINADPDLDGVMRKVPLFLRFEDKIFPQLSVSALLDKLNVRDIEIKKDFIIIKDAQFNNSIKDIKIPVDDNGCMLINWAGRWTSSFKHLPYYLVMRLQEIRQQLRRELSALDTQKELSDKEQALIEYMKNSESRLKEMLTGMVKDKICIVGLTATGTQDMGPIPFQPNFPMVGTHANLINTIITGNFIRRGGLSLNIFIFLFTALIIALSSLIKLWKSLLLAICYAVGYFLITFLFFEKFGLWIDLVGPEGIVIFGFSTITSFRYFTEEKEKLWIKQAFSHYLSKDVINELIENPSKLKLGGERKNITVLFSDVRGFTKFSEAHQPEEVVAMLNEILTESVEVVFKYSGTLDKFVGDELMAFFGAPGETHLHDHAIVAVRTAIDMQSKLKELFAKWEKEKKEPLHIGIGINSGDMVVGNMGSLERMDYTVIGDNVNLAARLCSAAAADEILISETTYEQVKNQVEIEILEPISVKGKAKPVAIYKVIGLK